MGRASSAAVPTLNGRGGCQVPSCGGRRRWKSTYDWYAAKNPAAAHGFREELRQAIAVGWASGRFRST
jgi:hypothetical protein